MICETVGNTCTRYVFYRYDTILWRDISQHRCTVPDIAGYDGYATIPCQIRIGSTYFMYVCDV